MYIIKVTIRNLRETGLLSGEDHLDNYRRGINSGAFHFHTLYQRNNGGFDSLYLISMYKDGIETAIRCCTEELGSHSLKPEFGMPERVKASVRQTEFGFKL